MVAAVGQMAVEFALRVDNTDVVVLALAHIVDADKGTVADAVVAVAVQPEMNNIHTGIPALDVASVDRSIPVEVHRFWLHNIVVGHVVDTFVVVVLDTLRFGDSVAVEMLVVAGHI